MAHYISIKSQYGNLTFDLDRPIVFQDTTFPTRERAIKEWRTLDGRSFPVLQLASNGEWIILVHGHVQDWERRAG